MFLTRSTIRFLNRQLKIGIDMSKTEPDAWELRDYCVGKVKQFALGRASNRADGDYRPRVSHYDP